MIDFKLFYSLKNIEKISIAFSAETGTFYKLGL